LPGVARELAHPATLKVEGPSRRLQDAVDLNTVRDDLAAVVDKTLEPVHVSVWMSIPE